MLQAALKDLNERTFLALKGLLDFVSGDSSPLEDHQRLRMTVGLHRHSFNANLMEILIEKRWAALLAGIGRAVNFPRNATLR
jgi:hypothetical protein